MSHAHVTITGEDSLYRRIAPDHYWPEGRVNSGAFIIKEDRVSVDLKRLTTVDQSLGSTYRGRNFGLAELLASIPLGLALDVSHDPIIENVAHCLINRFSENENYPVKTLRRLLADACTITVEPKPRNKGP